MKTARFSNYGVTDDNKAAYKIARTYVEKFDQMYEEQQGILFYGPVGTGKSFTAACIANELLDKGTPVIMTSLIKLIESMNFKTDNEEIINRLNSARLLILDDLGAERNTEYALEKVYSIIDGRYRAKKPLILTSNMTVKDMKSTTDDRYKPIYDRIFEMCVPIRVAGRSWREKEAERRFDKMRKILEE